jgi:hypothetical protein
MKMSGGEHLTYAYAYSTYAYAYSIGSKRM